MSRFTLKPTVRTFAGSELALHVFTDPEQLAFHTPYLLEMAVGESVPYGTLTAYMLRRFGIPNSACDTSKNLAAWELTTPLPDLVLRIMPSVSSDADLQFRFVVARKAAAALNDYDFAPRRAWSGRFFAWVKQRGLPEWLAACGDDDLARQSLLRAELLTGEHQAWAREAKASFCEIEPWPDLVARVRDWRTWPDGDPLKKYHQAAYDALRDLYRPVWVRDEAINAFGEVGPKRATRKIAWETEQPSFAPLAAADPGDLARLLDLIAAAGGPKQGVRAVLRRCRGLVNEPEAGA